MKSNPTLIRKGALFLGGFLLIVFLLNTIVLISIKNIEVGEFGVLNQINKGEIGADILICGSSRSLKAVNPRIVSEITGLKCYNISTDGTDLGVQIPKLRWYLNKNEKPKYIIQDLSQFGGTISETIYEPYKYLAYIKDDSLYAGLKEIDENLWMNKYLYPANLKFYNFDFFVKIFKESVRSFQNKETLIYGYSPDYSNWRGNMDLLKARKPDGVISSLSDKYVEYVAELVDLCETNDIKLIIAVLPNYFQINEINVVEDDVISYYSSLENRETIYFFNYEHSVISEEQSNFYNYMHLNDGGAKKFSKLMSKDLLDIL